MLENSQVVGQLVVSQEGLSNKELYIPEDSNHNTDYH
jgi:hypothetical protein